MNPALLKEAQSFITGHQGILPKAGKSKPALSPPPTGVSLDLSSFSGMLEYAPSEYTFTAQAGTPLFEVVSALAANGQFLPFDPPFIDRGATLGGTLASGLSGSGRYRYGGIRDFILAIRFLDGQGRLVRSGGKVVKNAAGFDLPKMMVGSLGAYGALVELTFKVFPRPPAYRTLTAAFSNTAQALAALTRLSQVPLDLFALDLQPLDERVDLVVRIGGLESSFPKRIQRLKALLNTEAMHELDPDEAYWHGLREFTWVDEGDYLVKVPLTPAHLPALDAFLHGRGTPRRYTVGANLAWISWAGRLDDLHQALTDQQLQGLVVLGSSGWTRLGMTKPSVLAQRVKQALDPQGRWLELWS